MKTSASFCKWLIVSAFAVFAATTLSHAQSSNCTPSPTGLVSWWKAEGTGLDSISGNNAFAALLPGGATFATGEVGQAFQLDNTNAYLFVPASPSLDVGAGTGLTMEGWIKVSSVSGFHPIAEWHGDTRETAGVQLWLNSYPTQSGALFGAVTDTNFGQHTLVSASDVIQPNVFQHVALTYDKASGIGTLYLNGAVVAQANLGSFVPATTDDLWIAHRPLDVPGDWTYGTTLGGLLDELSIYSRALSADEIAAIYNAGSAGKCDGSDNSSGTPAITQQPTNQIVTVGGTAAFSVTVAGSTPLYYQWYGPSSNVVVGAVNSTLTLSNVQSGNAGSYFVLVTNANGFAQSSNAVLTVNTVGSITNGLIIPNYSATNQIYTPDGSLNETLRMQMVYLASEFPSHPMVITEIRWRPDLSVEAPLSITISNLQIKLSTTKAIPDHLSTVFSQNTGNDETVVFNGIANVSSAFTTLSNGTTAFDIILPLQTPFVYDSTKGNLLVDLRNLYGCTPPRNNIVNGTGVLDATSRVFTTDPNATNAVVADTGGDVLEIIYNTTMSAAGPIIISQSTSQTVTVGTNAMFSVTATGTAPLHYQWFGPSNTLIPGAITSTLTLSNVQQSAAGVYFVSITNQFGFATSSNAVLTVTNSGTAPVITHQPTNETVAIGGTAVFSVTATGSPTPHYQWFGPTGAISGAATSTLTLSNVQPSAAGSYFAAVTNTFGINASATVVLTVTGGITNSCTPSPSGLVGWWPGEGNANDVVGGNNGTLVNGVGFATGEVGQGFLFTHTNQSVLIPASSNLNIGLGSGLTLEAWIKPTDITNYDPVFEWNAGDGVTYWGVHLYVLPAGGTPAGTLYANVQSADDNWHQLWSPTVVTANNLQHVALTYDKTSGVARMYRNGVMVAETTLGSFTPKTTGDLNIGRRPTDPANSSFTFSGIIDEPSVYNRALSSNEIAAIYFTGPGGKCPPVITPHSVISPQPVVNMSVAGNAPVLSWPVSAADFVLQSADSLTPPIKWTNVPATLQTNGDTIETTLPTGGQHGYFRLYQP